MAIRLQPVHQGSVAGRGRRKLSIAELATHGVERRAVVGLAVGVDTAGDIRRCGGHAGHCRPSSVCPDRSARGGWAGGQASDGRLCAGSYEVTPPDRARAKRHHPTGRQIERRTAKSRQAIGESDPAGGARYILTGYRRRSSTRMVAPKAFSASSKNAKWWAHQSSEPPCIITVLTTARAEQRSHRSAAVRGRDGFLSSETFISATPPRPSGDFLDIKCGSAHRDKSPHFELTLVPTCNACCDT